MKSDARVRCCPDGLITANRRAVKVLDCTIRDGGIVNDWQFSHQRVGDVFRALNQANVDYMEVGYRTQDGVFDTATTGPWRFCDEQDLVDAGVEPGAMKLSTMVDCHRVTVDDIPPKGDTVIDVVRIATYARHMDKAMRLLDHCLDAGYETFVNVMAVSTLEPDVVHTTLSRLARSGVHNVAIVDSFGALYPEHVRYLVRQYRHILGDTINVGVHFHNNLQQAFANSIAAIDEGVDVVDATLNGMGRGPGNCPLELLLLYLDNPRYNIAPVLEQLAFFDGLRPELAWGYQLPYMVTGQFNVHPQPGIEQVNGPNRHDVREMFDSLSRRVRLRKIG
ncbi:MAG: aldolase catalytic domain-containing protein [Myxococcota bacterium]